MNVTKGEVTKATVYQACNDEFRTGVILNKEVLRQSPWQKTKISDHQLDLIIDKDAQDAEEIFKNPGTAVPPDEILDSLNTTGVKIPIKQRDEFPHGAKLPSSDLIKALHYRMSKKIDDLGLKRAERSLDETALLALGMMVEKWADSLIDEQTATAFAEKVGHDSKGTENMNSENRSTLESSVCHDIEELLTTDTDSE